ncbi:hypothetical protein EV702DRAFT_628186 [Suillus placidus]|uniref:Uncharacterized protein n=1 Tax=Suillus placidus TaxID=48579 RepID=A0A9P6ZM19_9AGAM|nr:hypothetical protein EV702DRAFT_628186 [Suillus placidus]
MSSYPPHSDQEGIFTDFGGAPHEFTQAYLHDQWTQVQQLSRQQQSESHGMGDAVGEMLNFNEDQTPFATEFEGTGLADSYMSAPQPYAPQIYGSLAGGVPPNVPVSHQLEATSTIAEDDFQYPQHYLHQLPFHEMGSIGYLYQTSFDTVMSGPPAQELIRNSPVGPPFSEPQSHLTTTLPPAPPMESTNSMMSSSQSSPRYSPMTTSYFSGPSTLSSLNTSGVTAHSHSPATPLNRASQSPGFYGPDSMTGTGSRQSPISPSQKRPLESSADDSLHGRRVAPRHAGASNVHSLPSSGGTSTTEPISSSVPGRGPTVPQLLYNVGTTHAFHFTTGSGMPVVFNVAEGAGIPLQQLLHRQTIHLQARDERILDMSGDTISIRIEWPGYPSFTKQIASKDWKKQRSPNTRERLAIKVAGAVQSFFKHANTQCDPLRWRIGPNGIRIEQLALVSLHRVSQGSWQPKLCLLRDDAQERYIPSFDMYAVLPSGYL